MSVSKSFNYDFKETVMATESRICIGATSQASAESDGVIITRQRELGETNGSAEPLA